MEIHLGFLTDKISPIFKLECLKKWFEISIIYLSNYLEIGKFGILIFTLSSISDFI